MRCCCRRGFPGVLRVLDKVIDNMAGMPPGAELDMNNVTLRISLDVTGIVGFAKDFRTCASFKDAGTDELFTIIQKSEQPLVSESQCVSSAREIPDLQQPFHNLKFSQHILGLLYAPQLPHHWSEHFRSPHISVLQCHSVLQIRSRRCQPFRMLLQRSGSCTAGRATLRGRTCCGSPRCARRGACSGPSAPAWRSSSRRYAACLPQGSILRAAPPR